MLSYYGQVVVLFLALMSFIAQSENLSPNTNSIGKRWAVLVAGSNNYDNYRHQADVCHAYQILKKGGLKDENIIVFMYDDIAFNPENPRPGIIINKPNGDDVYYGVPKDYTGENATADNFLAVLLGKKSALNGGSGKVLNSGPNDHIFIYYADHGTAGLVGMPSGDPLYAKDLIKVLKKMYERKTYKRMVFYMEACESGSMFEGLLPNNWNIYAVTAANAEESSYAAYCPDYSPPPPPEFDTCLGDVFSISWLEDSDVHDMSKETVGKQYSVVKRRTGHDDINLGSHVMEYGSMELRKDFLSFYIGTDPINQNFTAFPDHYFPPTRDSVKQVDADLLHYKRKVDKTLEGSEERIKAVKKLEDVLAHRRHVDRSINQIVKILFGEKNGPEIMNFVRPSGQPLVDDWDCFKILMKVYEKECGISSWYGKKYSRAIANMCNAGISVAQMIVAANQACFKLE